MKSRKSICRRRLVESLIGPVMSTIFHVALIVVLSILVKDKYKVEPAESK